MLHTDPLWMRRNHPGNANHPFGRNHPPLSSKRPAHSNSFHPVVGGATSVQIVAGRTGRQWMMRETVREYSTDALRERLRDRLPDFEKLARDLSRLADLLTRGDLLALRLMLTDFESDLRTDAEPLTLRLWDLNPLTETLLLALLEMETLIDRDFE